jgi:hypothetical protein
MVWSFKDLMTKAPVKPKAVSLKTPPVELPPGVPHYKLDPLFVLAVNAFTSAHDKRTFQAKLKAFGISPAKFSNWLREERYFAYYKMEVNKAFSSETPLLARQALLRSVEAGDLNAIKFFLEYSGEYRPQAISDSQTLANVTTILAKLMEILTRYLQPEALEAVAREIETTCLEAPQQKGLTA